MTQDEILLGKGLIFPITLDDNGRATIHSGEELIRSSIKNIIAFIIGDRFFLREFGANTANLLDELNTELLADVLQVQLSKAINTYEKRVEKLAISVAGDGGSKLNIRISYTIRQTQKFDSFIAPFYKDIYQNF